MLDPSSLASAITCSHGAPALLNVASVVLGRCDQLDVLSKFVFTMSMTRIVSGFRDLRKLTYFVDQTCPSALPGWRTLRSFTWPAVPVNLSVSLSVVVPVGTSSVQLRTLLLPDDTFFSVPVPALSETAVVE